MQVLVHVSQGKPFWYRSFVPYPSRQQSLSNGWGPKGFYGDPRCLVTRPASSRLHRGHQDRGGEAPGLRASGAGFFADPLGARDTTVKSPVWGP